MAQGWSHPHHEEAHREDAGGLQELAGRIALREEGGREIEGEEGVAVKVVPLDEVAGRRADDGKDAAPAVGGVINRAWRDRDCI